MFEYNGWGWGAKIIIIIKKCQHTLGLAKCSYMTIEDNRIISKCSENVCLINMLLLNCLYRNKEKWLTEFILILELRMGRMN